MKYRQVTVTSIGKEGMETLPAQAAVCGCGNDSWYIFQIDGHDHIHMQCAICHTSYCPAEMRLHRRSYPVFFLEDTLMNKEELKTKARYFAHRQIYAEPRTIYRDENFVDGFVAVIGTRRVMWEKAFCETREEAIEEARLFQANALRVYQELTESK